MNATMKDYQQGHPIPGGIPETKLRVAFSWKLKKMGQSFTDEQWEMLRSCDITQDTVNAMLESCKWIRN